MRCTGSERGRRTEYEIKQRTLNATSICASPTRGLLYALILEQALVSMALNEE